MLNGCGQSGSMRALVSVWLAIIVARCAAAQMSSVALKVETVDAAVRESFTAQLIISDFQTADEPQFPNLTNAIVSAAGVQDGTSAQYDGRSGRMISTRSRRYNFDITPLKEGVIEIPAIALTVDGRQLSTDPVRIRVRAGDGDDLAMATISCSAPKLYVGQQALFTLTIWIKPAKAFNRILTEDEMFGFIRQGGGSYGEFATAQIEHDRRSRRDASGIETTYYVYELKARKILDEPGPTPFKDVVVGVRYPVKFAQDRFFGDVSVSRARSLKIVPETKLPEVQPLPAAGRPANFNGAVGVFALDVTANPTDVRVGDPIELTLVISGSGPLDTLRPPSLTSLGALTDGFRVPTEELTGKMEGGRRLLSQFVRAKNASVTEIPPLEFAYFDPTRGEYAVARSKPIPLHVTASAELDARDLTNIKTEQRSPQSQAVETTDGLRGIEVREERLLASTPPITMPQVVAVALAPPFAALGIWSALALVRSSGANVAGRRRAAAATNARKRIDAAAGKPPIELSRQIEAALGEYLADRYNLPIGRTMGKAGVALLRERLVDESALKLWSETIERCEGALYGGNAAGDASLAQQASECIAAIERGKA